MVTTANPTGSVSARPQGLQDAPASNRSTGAANAFANTMEAVGRGDRAAPLEAGADQQQKPIDSVSRADPVEVLSGLQLDGTVSLGERTVGAYPGNWALIGAVLKSGDD